MISQTLITDERFNSISIEAQNIFIRMLSVSDDCGVVPANSYTLNTLINSPPRTRKHIQDVIDEIVAANLGSRFDYSGEQFFAFKLKSFEEYQSYILKKATKSEYLRIPKDEFLELSKKFQEIPRNSGRVDEGAVSTVESRKKKVEGSEYKVKSIKTKEVFGEFANVFLTVEEFDNLVTRLGNVDRVKAGIEILSAYKESKGKKYTSDYATFATWVIGELEKRESNGTHKQGTGNNYGSRQSITADDLRRTSEEVKRRVNR